jgi:hypothetical protein
MDMEHGHGHGTWTWTWKWTCQCRIRVCVHVHVRVCVRVMFISEYAVLISKNYFHLLFSTLSAATFQSLNCVFVGDV